VAFPKPAFFLSLFLVGWLLASCGAPARMQSAQQYGIKDPKPDVWTQRNQKINQYIQTYSSNNHVQVCLSRAEDNGYLPYIHRVFFKYRLPPELSLLPILESCFDTEADSGRARGMWQFTKATAGDYGLRVNWLTDDRLNWRKSTHSAAKYLSVLGERFNHNWELALAAYNGGPNYLDRTMKKQRVWNFWKLQLREETAEYVPKFLAMLHVARQRFPELYYAGGPRFWRNAS
jgi:membrane-bound lytic murein transglycosylase D